MKFCRYDDNSLGVVREAHVYDASDILQRLPALHWPYPLGDQFVASLDDIWEQLSTRSFRGPARAVDEVVLRSPVANPSKIVAAPVNYRLHVEEAQADPEIHANRSVLKIGDAGLFLKATSSLCGPGDGIVVHMPERRTDHEVELAVVIGKACRNVAQSEALQYVAGYAVGLDITIRGAEDRSFRKSLDTYSVLGPWLVTRDEIPDPGSLDLELAVNGVVRQRSNTCQLIYDVPKLIAWASTWYTLLPGDIILTGTPEGVGPVAPGDTLVATIDRIGTMTVNVTAPNAMRSEVAVR